MVADLGSIQAELNDPNLSILEKIGNGAFGSVYLAYDQQLKRDVAIKILHIWHLADNDTVKSRFLQEAKVLAGLEHKNLLKVYELRFSSKSRPYITSEYLIGESLASYINKNKPVPLRKCLEIALQVCQGMAYAEKHNVVHRDLKPENIFLCTEGSEQIAKILDFGLCLDLSIDKKLRDFSTVTGQLLGSPPFMSPEQCLGKKADCRSDIYSFGCILYEILTGECLFKGDNHSEVILKHLSETLSFVDAQFRSSGFPKQLNQVLLDCLNRDPRKRPQSFSEVHSRLMELYKSDCTGKFDLELLNPVETSPRNSSGKALKTVSIALAVCTFFIIANIPLFFLSSEVRSYQLRLMQALPVDLQSSIVSYCLDPLLQFGCKEQAEELGLAFLKSTRFIAMPAPARCIITTYLLQKLESSCSDNAQEQIILSLYGDLFDLFDYLPYRNVKEKTKALVRIPAETLLNSVRSRKHTQSFWRRILDMRMDLPTMRRHYIYGMSQQIYELQTLSLKQKERKTPEQYEKLIISLLNQANSYYELYLYNPDAEQKKKEYWLQQMDAVSREVLSILRIVESEEHLKNEVRILGRAKTQAYLFMAIYASLKGTEEPAMRYLRTARENDRITGGGQKLIFEAVNTTPGWEDQEAKIRANLQKKELVH